MEAFNDFLRYIDSFIGSSQWFVFALVGTGLFFTIYLRFPQIRYFRHAGRVMMGKYDKKGDRGDTSHFQSLATALSGTVGTGNIAGVALAIHLGGPSALFWMMVTAFFGMTTKFVEVSLSHKYREFTSDGTVSGGPMYYMKNRLKMPWLAAFFAVATIFSAFGTGSLPQVNSIANSMHQTFGLDHMITGLVLSILLALIIVGGIKRIAKVTSLLVPFMAVVYFIGVLCVILYNYDNFLPAVASIFTNVFSGTAATGGFLGATVAFALNRGVNRGLFSNEAGQGSSPIAHAAARTKEPVSEGMVSILEPFIDTIIICFLTGVALLSSGVWNEKYDNVFQLTDMQVLEQLYDGNNEKHIQMLGEHVSGTNTLPLFTGELEIIDGKPGADVSILHNRSLAENVQFWVDNELYNGHIAVRQGKVNTSVRITGESLLHSAPLSTIAFTRSFFGDWGKYIVTFGLLLFAFSTAIAWSYYGDRAVTYLAGNKWVMPFRIFFCITFFVASFTDTTIIWNFSGITVALMTLPNLFGILYLSREMKKMERDYRKNFNEEHPNEKI
ncbi:MAG: sodium:alanine symporter family protein [Prevotellaceae bacterium]|jgi:AGCS family alanine or glycine:cation symporter|nr:sodium:alanine symporter family protein [Prevotellaceae bacterium]